MTSKAVIYEEKGRVALISLNRPEALNASSYRLRADLMDAIKCAEENEQVRIVVLTGEGRGFSAGADLTEGFSDHHDNVTYHILKDHKPIIDSIRHSEKTYIAALNGAVAGIGVGYALVCDLVTMGQSAYIYSPFAAISLVPDGGVTWYLTKFLGRARAYEMIITNGRMTSEECFQAGIANKIFDDEKLRDGTLNWADELAGQVAPLAMRYAKKSVWAATEQGLFDTIKTEATFQRTCIESEDFMEGVSAFAQKRKPTFKGQ